VPEVLEHFGAVCDVSALTSRGNVDRARELFNDSTLYLPASTYAWLSRDKLIGVRGQVVGYSLVSQYVQERKIHAVHLPELYDELARRLMFRVDRQIPLTDIRALLLAAHMRLPLLTFRDELIRQLEEYARARGLWELKSHMDWLATREILELYRELQVDVGGSLCQHISGDFTGDPFDEIQKRNESKLRSTAQAVERISQGQTNRGRLNFKCLTWGLVPVAREYLEQRVLQPETVRRICERALLLIASPEQ
jgi:hypothetical protein